MKTPPPLPKKKAAVFHHPLGFELYDSLAMDLHAMTYAEPMLKEIEQLRDCAERVIAAFETLGRTRDTAGLLNARARCESVMLELKHLLTPNDKGNRLRGSLRNPR